MQDSNEREDWEDLLSSKGWGRLVNYYHRMLHDQFEDQVSHVIAKGGDVEHIKQLVACRKFAQEIFTHPKLRLEQIAQAQASREPSGSRRGPL